MLELGNAQGGGSASMNSGGSGEQTENGFNRNLMESIAQLNDDSIKPQMNLSDYGYDQRRPQLERLGLVNAAPDAPMSFAPGSIVSNASTTSFWDAEGNLAPIVTTTGHKTVDDYLSNGQDNVNNFATKMDDVASAADSSTGARIFAAATYGVRKIAGDTVSGMIGLPRLITSDSMAPGIINAAMNPQRTLNGMVQQFGGMSLQDKWVTGLEFGLGFKGGIENLAGRIPRAGGYLAGDLSYASGQGVTLSANGKMYGFIGDGVANQAAGPYSYQAGAIGGARIGEIDVGTGSTGSSRTEYMGSTPGKYSRTGREVVERMQNEGMIQGDGPLLRGNPNNLKVVGPDGNFYAIDHTIDMAHTTDAVTWWNETGRFYGPKALEVRNFMLDSNNYKLEPMSFNRSAGAKLGQTYLPPDAPIFDF